MCGLKLKAGKLTKLCFIDHIFLHDTLFFFTGCLKTYIPVSLLNTNVRKRSLLHCIKEGGANNLVVDDGKLDRRRKTPHTPNEEYIDLI